MIVFCLYGRWTVGKARLLPCTRRKEERSAKPLETVYMDFFSSSVRPIGRIFSCHSRSGRCDQKSLDVRLEVQGSLADWSDPEILSGSLDHWQTIDAVRKWHRDPADFHAAIIMIQARNEARTLWFVQSVSAKHYHSTAYEQWQGGLAESSVGSLTRMSRNGRELTKLGRFPHALRPSCWGGIWSREKVFGTML